MNYLVVGASSGIGAEVANLLKSQGHQVFTAQRRNVEGLPHISFDASQPNFDFSILPDELHGVVYAPGTIQLKPFHRFSMEDFQHDFQVNVLGAVHVLQGCLPKLKKANGANVVLFSSVAAQMGMGFHASIAAAKSAIEGLTRSLAAEWAPAQIKVNAIAPSLTNTPLASSLLSTPEKMEASAKRHPLGRVGESADLAASVQFLLQPNLWMTGTVLQVDGGMGNTK
jgi:NAD(P)-dependent dehydrogenase (short-subunit alcohol dehydrogenase family)